MRILHRVSVNATNEIAEGLRKLGLTASVGFNTYRLWESDPRLAALQGLSSSARFFDFLETEFTAGEIRNAAWLALEPSWHWGFPMPDKGGGYLERTYDRTSYCERCGIGAIQKAEFSLAREPVWGRRSVLQLNWVHDEFFAKPETWLAIFKPFGIGCRPVRKYGSDEVLERVVQLDFSRLAEMPLQLRDIERELCPACGRGRYSSHLPGFFPPFVSSPREGHAFRTVEWWGSGCYAAQRIVISAALCMALLENRVRGVEFTPGATGTSGT